MLTNGWLGIYVSLVWSIIAFPSPNHSHSSPNPHNLLFLRPFRLIFPLSLSLLLPLSSFIFNLNLILILHMIIIIMLSNSYSSPSSCHMFNPKVKRPGSLLTHQTPLSPQAQFRLFGCRDNGRKSPIKVFLKNPAYISWDHYFKSQSDHFWT